MGKVYFIICVDFWRPGAHSSFLLPQSQHFNEKQEHMGPIVQTRSLSAAVQDMRQRYNLITHVGPSVTLTHKGTKVQQITREFVYSNMWKRSK